jgi:hypothetical protein
MKTSSVWSLAVILAVCFYSNFVLGDLGPHSRPMNHPIRGEMRNAEVFIKISLTPSNTIQAEVDGQFDMRFSGDCVPHDPKDVTLTVDFPISFSEDKQPQPTDFKTSINGQLVTNVVQKTWYMMLPDANNPSRLVDGCVWTCKVGAMKIPVRRHFVVHYTLNLKKEGDEFPFIYFLRTGGMWDDPIGQEMVKLTIQKGLKASIVPPTLAKPRVHTDGEIVWLLTNVRPSEDIHLKVALDSKQTGSH